MAESGTDYGLQTIKDGQVPECRMKSAQSVQDFVRRVIDADDKRERKRGLVAGLVDGNAPFSAAKMKANNRALDCNVNWGSARSTLESGSGAFYDLVYEVPGVVVITQEHGNEENRVDWSRIMSEEADLVFNQEQSWDSQIQTSQTETVLYGHGPMFFEDKHRVFPVAVEDDCLKVPDRTPSDLAQWEICVVLREYYPPQLYEFIQNVERAEAIGWNVDYTMQVIERAVDQKTPPDQTHNALWYQTEMKSNSFDYFDNVCVCRVAHTFWREFNGRVSHAIVKRDDFSSTGTDYLFLSVNRYANFYEVIHPMYFDKGRGGYHHNVTGLGVKQYSGFEYENRLLCGMMDAAMAPKILFKPTTAEAATKFQLNRFGQFGIVSPGLDVSQTPIQGLLQDSMIMYRTSSDLMRSNLSQYRQPVQPDRPGNPETALEVRLKASQSGSLSSTTFNRYYKQLDTLYAEIVRRLCNLNSTDKRAIAYQERCQRRGVPAECFGRVKTVQAVRVVGQGPAVMRQATMQTLMPVINRLPETGQRNLMNDFIASHAGQSQVKRYNPDATMSMVGGDQHERAGNQITGMTLGKPADFSPSQNPVIFAATFIQACNDAIQSIQKGADPAKALGFVELAAPAALQHVKRILGDPTRAQIGKELEKAIKRIGQTVDKLRKMLAQQAQKRQQQQRKTATVLNDLQLKNLETRAKIQDRAIKTRAQLSDKAVKSRQDMALKDATAATDVRLKHFKSLSGE